MKSGHYSSFTELTSKVRELPIIGFDSEDNSRGTPTIFSFYSKDGPFVTRHFSDAMEYIYSIEEPSVFVAHNLEYDLVNFFKHDDYVMLDELRYASKLLSATIYDRDHIFIDSMSFYMGSLKNMGKMVGIKKMEGSAYDEKYAEIDAKIVYTWMRKFQKRLVEDEGVKLGISVGQLSMAIYRRNYMLHKRQITYNNPKILDAYYGGRVEVFYKGNVRDLEVIDINSSYPFQMQKHFYPDTSKIETSRLSTHEFGVGTFTVFVPKDMFIPVLPYKDEKTDRLFFPTGKFKGTWCYAEMRYAVSMGVKIIRENNGIGTNRGCKPFKNFIDDYYDKRLDAKILSEKDPDNLDYKFDIWFYKLVMNSNYGKWNQHKIGNLMTRDELPGYKLKQYIDHPDFKTFKIGPFYSYNLPKINPPKTANYFWGTYVTAYARMHLHSGLKAVHDAGHTLLYCDTDSIMYSRKNPTSPLPISKKLGEWDIEKFDVGVFEQAKGYLLCNKTDYGKLSGQNIYMPEKVACKGVSTRYAWDFILKGMAIVRKPIRLKDGLIRTHAVANANKDPEFLKEISANVWNDVKKEMKSIYIKRRGQSGITYPQDAEDLGEIIKNSKIDEIIDKTKELEKNEIHIQRPHTENKFNNPVVPDKWFDGERKIKNSAVLRIPAKIPSLAYLTAKELPIKTIWYAGDVLYSYSHKNGKKYVVFNITNYKGKKTPQNFIMKLPAPLFYGFFRNNYDMDKKHLTITMEEIYSGNGYPKISIKEKTSLKK